MIENDSIPRERDGKTIRSLSSDNLFLENTIQSIEESWIQMLDKLNKLFENTVEVFKTNIDNRQQFNILKSEILNLFPETIISIDLEDCDKVLRIEGIYFDAEQIRAIVKTYGFECKILD